MTNCEKYKTAKERAEAFREYCRSKGAKCRETQGIGCIDCQMGWLDLEAATETPLPCPFCGCDCCCVQTDTPSNRQYVWCENCGYCTGSNFDSEAEAVAAHNRVARAVEKAKADAKARTNI